MTGELKRKAGRPPGAKNKRKDPVAFKALRDMDAEFIESAYKYLSADLDNLPKPRTAMDKLVENTFQQAIAGEKTSHQYAKLIFERVIPQRKQVEHLGEQDAHRLGVNINVITEKAQHEEHGITIEHEPERGQESVRRDLHS